MTTHTSPGRPPPGANAQIPLDAISAALEGLRYGAVEIVVHDGRVVQIERKEKLRFDGTTPSKRFETVKNA